MKRMISCLLALLMILLCGIPICSADAEPPYEAVADTDGLSDPAATGAARELSPAGDIPIPKIEIDTADGRGAQLLKADGYVDAQISITDTDGGNLSGAIQFKVRGNSTAIDSIPKKGFTFKYDKKTNVLGMGKGKKWALLANCFDPTLLRNYLIFDLAERLGLPYVSNQCYAELWLDGSYRGCYTVYEPVQEGTDRVDIDTDGNKDFLLEYEASRSEDDITYINISGVRFAISEPDPPDDDQTAYITDVMTDIASTMRYGTQEQIREKLDIDSFAKYYLLNEYAKTLDFGMSSVFFFYKDGKLYAGPPWDYDLALGNANSELQSPAAKEGARSDGIMQASKNLYRWLGNKSWFIDEVRRVYAAYYDDFAAISSDGGTLDTLRAEYQSLFNRNFGIWKVSRWWLNYQRVPLATYEDNYSFLKNWCSERNTWLTEYYGLSPYTYVVGDADGNGEVEIIDVTLIQRYLANIPTTLDDRAVIRCAVTGEELGVIDATVIQRFLSEMNPPYPIGEQKTVMVVG